MPPGASFLEDVPLVEFMYFVLLPCQELPQTIQVYCCAPCLLSAINSLRGVYRAALGLILFQITEKYCVKSS